MSLNQRPSAMDNRPNIRAQWEKKFGTAEFEVPGAYLTPDEFVIAVRETIDRQEPASFVRYSDGEGGFLVQSARPPECAISAELRKGLLPHFFGCHGEQMTMHDLHRAAELLRQSISDADMIGMPFLTDLDCWVERRREVGDLESIRVSLALEELFSEFLARFDPSRQRFTYVGFHTWFIGGRIFRFLARSTRVGFITCFPELGPAIQKLLPRATISMIEVPPRGADADLRDSRPHFPEVFDEIASTLTVPYHGAPFIIGAGPLGKAYCSLVKARGGIGIDLGSVFDLWMRKGTRTWITPEVIEKYSIPL